MNDAAWHLTLSQYKRDPPLQRSTYGHAHGAANMVLSSKLVSLTQYRSRMNHVGYKLVIRSLHRVLDGGATSWGQRDGEYLASEKFGLCMWGRGFVHHSIYENIQLSCADSSRRSENRESSDHRGTQNPGVITTVQLAFWNLYRCRRVL